MLVLTRKSSEGITLNTSDGVVHISVSTGNNTQVKVAIDAPQAVKVHRDELIESNKEVDPCVQPYCYY
jgi:carbon storage regulator CsrA